MSALPGLLVARGGAGVVNVRLSDVSAHAGEVDVAWPPQQDAMAAAVIGALQTHWPVAADGARAIAGLHVGSYSDDYYHRIHLVPDHLALGNVVGVQAADIALWNAYLHPKQVLTLDGVEDGIEVTPPAALPLTLGALRETVWQVSVTPDGPSVLDAQLLWVFADAPSVGLRLTGNRIVPWTFVPNWQEPVVEQLRWLTDVLASPRGGEQRRSLRIAPRRSLQAQVLADGAERALLDLALAGWGRRVWAVPVWPDVQWLAAPLAAGSMRIDCTVEGFDFRAGGLAMLRGDGAFDSEAVEIDALDAGGLTLKRATQASWPAGARLYPVRAARLAEMPQTQRLTDRLVQAQVQFEMAEASDWPPALPALTYRGRPVFALRPDESRDLTHGYERLVQQLDPGPSLPAVTDAAAGGFVLQQHRWMLAGRTERSAWRALMYGLCGRAQSVWVPTHAQDLVLAAASAGSVLSVERAGYARFGVGTWGRRDIRIELVDGSALHRRITSASESGETETLVLDADLPASIEPAQVARISYMALCRLASDDVEIEHLTDGEGVARAAVNWRGVRDDLEALA